MTEDEAVVALAGEAGLEVAWTDACGHQQTAGIDTLRAVLAALELPAGARGEIRDSHARLLQEKKRTPPLIVARAGEAVFLDGGNFAEIEDESGKTKTLRLHKASDSRAFFRAPRAPGYYRIESGSRETALAVAPARALLPGDIAGARKLAHKWRRNATSGSSARAGGNPSGTFTRPLAKRCVYDCTVFFCWTRLIGTGRIRPF